MTPLSLKSDSVRYVDVTPMGIRQRILKPYTLLKTLPKDSTSIYNNDPVLDYYPNRPAVLEATSLYEFRRWYDLERNVAKT